MRFRETISVDDYVLDVLMRDIVGHDRQPAAYLVYLYLYGQAARAKWKPVAASLRTLAEATGLSKSAVQTALGRLRRRELIETASDHATAIPKHCVLRHWRSALAFKPRPHRKSKT
ncbi:MAG TPA: helix-turn-helix domain-containing protein [Chthoniobacterales bacterium]|nr:helix-turn-helix domain-containing protein [Chthoniobacterales bacterium]